MYNFHDRLRAHWNRQLDRLRIDEKRMGDTVGLRGGLRLDIIEADGRVRCHHDSRNLIVTVGRSYLARVISDAAETFKIDTIQCGTGGGLPTPPLPSDTALGDPSPFSKAIGTINYPSAGVVEFIMLMTNGEGNGAGSVDYNEAGLFNDDSPIVMFARQTFAAVTKTAAIQLQWTWTVNFAQG
jgi:hypothetical protein